MNIFASGTPRVPEVFLLTRSLRFAAGLASHPRDQLASYERSVGCRSHRPLDEARRSGADQRADEPFHPPRKRAESTFNR